MDILIFLIYHGGNAGKTSLGWGAPVMIKHIYTIEKVGIYRVYAISKGSDRGVLTARVPAQAYQHCPYEYRNTTVFCTTGKFQAFQIPCEGSVFGPTSKIPNHKVFEGFCKPRDIIQYTLNCGTSTIPSYNEHISWVDNTCSDMTDCKSLEN